MTDREQFLSDIIVTAIEGGIGYWSATQQYRAEGRMVVGQTHRLVRYTQELTCAVIEDIESEGHEIYTITSSVIEQGIARILNGQVSYPSYAVDGLALADAVNDAGLIDADDADDIVQAALLGEIRYG